MSVLCTVAFVAAACGSSSKSGSGTSNTTAPVGAQTNQTIADNGPPKVGGSITVGLEAEDSGYNPASASTRWDISGTEVGLAIYDPMVAFDASGNWQPYLAQSLKPNADYTVWTVTMRSGVTFQNGEPLTADAVTTAYKAFIGNALTGPVFSDVTSVKTTGQLTLEFDMKTPWVVVPGHPDRAGGHDPGPGDLRRQGRGHRGQQLPPDRHRSVRLRAVGPERPLHGQQVRQVLAQGLQRRPAAVSQLDQLQADT